MTCELFMRIAPILLSRRRSAHFNAAAMLACLVPRVALMSSPQFVKSAASELAGPNFHSCEDCCCWCGCCCRCCEPFCIFQNHCASCCTCVFNGARCHVLLLGHVAGPGALCCCCVLLLFYFTTVVPSSLFHLTQGFPWRAFRRVGGEEDRRV